MKRSGIGPSGPRLDPTVPSGIDSMTAKDSTACSTRLHGRMGAISRPSRVFRPSLTFYAELAAITGEKDYVASGIVDLDWRDQRRIGEANITGGFADVRSSKCYTGGS